MTALLLATVLGCGTTMRPVEGTLPCEDTAVAISRRTFECTADRDLANARYDLFFEQYTCKTVDFETDVDAPWYDVIEDAPGDWFHCSWAVGELPCELVEEYGDDLDRWLSASPVCPYVIDGIGGGAE
ncbi:MAG: hypothetical protein H6742_15015 [Alphaproteobacteria bacterium]|nr:hypothetical protein [Alphaproteobacteria bacterium]